MPDPEPDSKISEQDRSRNLKKWLVFPENICLVLYPQTFYF